MITLTIIALLIFVPGTRKIFSGLFRVGFAMLGLAFFTGRR